MPLGTTATKAKTKGGDGAAGGSGGGGSKSSDGKSDRANAGSRNGDNGKGSTGSAKGAGSGGKSGGGGKNVGLCKFIESTKRADGTYNDMLCPHFFDDGGCRFEHPMLPGCSVFGRHGTPLTLGKREWREVRDRCEKDFGWKEEDTAKARRQWEEDDALDATLKATTLTRGVHCDIAYGRSGLYRHHIGSTDVCNFADTICGMFKRSQTCWRTHPTEPGCTGVNFKPELAYPDHC